MLVLKNPHAASDKSTHGGGGREGGPMRSLGTDHVISGPMKCLKKTASDGADRQNHGHGDSMTELAQWGRFSENMGYR